MKKHSKVLSIFLSALLIMSMTMVQTMAEMSNEVKVPLENICKSTIDENFSVDKVLVTIRHEYSDFQRVFTAQDFPEISQYIVEVKNPEPIDTNKEYPMLNIEEYKTILQIKLNTDSKEDVLSCIRKLETNYLVFRAYPEYVGIEFTTSTPNDPYFSEQYALQKIKAVDAWDIVTGSNDVKVGVIDSGVLEHPDLVSSLVQGYDFYNDNTITNDDGCYDYDQYGIDMIPYFSHGTAVAGVIAATTNNQIGVCGIASGIEIVPLQVSIYINGQKNLSVASIIEAINYATINDIPIINLSLGGFFIEDPFCDALNNYKGLAVCSSGNDGENIDELEETLRHYPSSSNVPNVIAVASSNEVDELNSWSNFGEVEVDVVAPGSDIHSLYSLAYDENGTYNPYYAYGMFSGTSFAAPMVSGAAALLLSYNSTLNGQQLKRAILDNVDIVSALNGKVATSGRLNVKKALEAIFPTEKSRDYRFDIKVETPNIGMFSLPVECDLSLCQFFDCVEGDNLTDPSFFMCYYDYVNDVANVMYTGFQYPITQSGTLATLFYKSPFISTDADYFPTIAYNSNYYYRDPSNNTISPNVTCTTVLMGDTNSDNEIDADDALRVMQYRNGSVELSSTELLAADVNLDNVIDLSDVLTINQYVVGKINTFIN
ncbi:MAG: S8 family serine peptidase [Clostridia bacterium]|nr:S8 family serine peptidase [Clostridia bacterium]